MDIKGQRYDNTPTQAFDVQSSVIYVGYAARGASASDPVWTIAKITLVSGLPTYKTWSRENGAVWDNRASETYT